MAIEEDITPADGAKASTTGAGPTVEEQAEYATFEQFGSGWEPAYNFEDTNKRIRSHLAEDRPNNPPPAIEEFECRIGGSKFFIPPLSISVNQRFKTGSLVGGALRQQNTPKFNSGNTETVISMTLYFPTVETVWGLDDWKLDINFDDMSVPDSTIDEFLSSLRGLLAQFKYAPFLPIRNAYLNQVFNITGVALKDISVSTVPNYPFCMAVQLVMYKFNHKAYIPMIENFDQAVHWGRFRQYMGRAAVRTAQSTTGLNIFNPETEQIGDPQGTIDPSLKRADEILENYESLSNTRASIYKLNEVTASRFDLYFPFYSPAEIDVPDLSDLKYKPIVQVRSRNWWEKAMGVLGYNPDIYSEADYDLLQSSQESGETYIADKSDSRTLFDYLNYNNIAFDAMGPNQLEAYLDQQYREKGVERGSNAGEELSLRVRGAWFYAMYRMFLENPTTAAALASEDKKRRQLTIDEWEVPMWRLGGREGINPKYVTVQGISMTMGNVLARLQLQMQDEPTHQHIGGEDTRIEISLIFHGDRAEEYLLKFRNMFDSITGLSRLEHNHGVLGFLGIRNPITELAGVSHVIPLSFTVDTVENFPHVYRVTLSLVDFDVFQQRREELTVEQQAELVNAFGKRNPMLRVKQLWGMFNAYPDFPLSVRDENNRVVGHVDPDYYFRSFKSIDDDIVDPIHRTQPGSHNTSQKKTNRDLVDRLTTNDKSDTSGEYDFMNEDGVHVCLGSVDGDPQYISVNDDGFSIRDGKNTLVDRVMYQDQHGGQISTPAVDGNTPPAGHVEPYCGGTTDPRANFDLMAKDMQYRDKSGRMVRAFPTYMLWLIDEGGNFAGTKLFNNFYGLQSVIDMSISRSEDIMADTMILRVSNLYSKLTTNFKDYFDEDEYTSTAAVLMNELTTRQLRLASGIGEYLVDLETIRLKPGVRLHMRLGYGSNPNSLETVFNGMITEVQEGDILTIVAQSDAIELGAMVNNTNEKGHTGKVDGTMVGFYMSEPRDLMLNLLTQGSSVVKEVIAHATQGEIFSENRYGIKHFGTMMYTPLTHQEIEGQKRQRRTLSARINQTRETKAGNEADPGVNTVEALSATGGAAGAVSGATANTLYTAGTMVNVLNDAFVNLSTKRDLEIFKRNIYPGNGVGVAQFMGGDFGDMALDTAIDGSSTMQTTTGINADGTGIVTDPLSGAVVDTTPIQQLEEAIQTKENSDSASYDYNSSEGIGFKDAYTRVSPPNPALMGLDKIGRATIGSRNFATTKKTRSELLETLGIASASDDDGAFDEVAFRAQTYMKTVWDLFKICAALLPDYIVAVRPFEDRSTVFYGKPHWLYTSGVMPLTTGANPNGPVSYASPDSEFKDIYRLIEQEYAKRDSVFENDLVAAVRATQPGGAMGMSYDPTMSTQGMAWDGNASSLLSSFPTTNGSGRNLPHSQGPVGIEMHIPTSENLQEDIVNQEPSNAGLPPELRHPFYMDRINGGRGGVSGTNTFDPTRSPLQQTKMAGENPLDPGNTGRFGYLEPEDEKWYMCQLFPQDDVETWRGARVLIYNPDQKRGVVCTPGDRGPANGHGVVAGCSPEAWIALGQPGRSEQMFYRVMPASTPLGPVSFDGNSTAPSVESGGSQYENEGGGGRFAGGGTDPSLERLSELPDWAEGNEDLRTVSKEKGHIVQGIPVNYSPGGAEESEFQYDILGEQAAKMYHPHRSHEAANDIWDEAKSRFPVHEETRNRYRDNHYEVKDLETHQEKQKAAPDDIIEELAVEFLKLLWQDGTRRGWLARVTHADTKVTLRVNPDLGNNDTWELGMLMDAWTAYIRAQGSGNPEQALDTFIQNNQKVGTDIPNPALALAENAVRRTDDILDQIGKIVSSIGSIGSGLFDFVRFSLFQMTEGIGFANDMQAKSNALNAIYDDSIYFRAGIDDAGNIANPLLYYADNPFTREYGEPVAEIREPFQRLHTLSSFNHIISNGIQESLNDVATVVTGISNGADPVTVHFDKGIPSERQIERTIETGLFWDDPGFWGLLNPLNWYQQARESSLKARGNPPELSAKRIALSHLKEGLKDIYGGELMVLGDPGIRPYDLVYMADVYERMYGFFEVEQVTHHFTPETGFITSITPNACVTINDPGRFYLMTQHRANQSIKTMRERMRAHFNVRADQAGDIEGSGDDAIEIEEFEKKFEDTIRGSGQFHGGASSIVKAMTGLGAGVGVGAAAVAGAGAAASAATGGIGGILGWKAWGWVRDNLLDQHGCSIAYLTKNGEPMDASLSYAEGVAVGHQNSMSLILGGLKITEITKSDREGKPKIKTGDVIKSLQWDETGPNDLAQEVSLFHAATLAELRDVSGRYGEWTGDDGGVEAVYGQIRRVTDGDTIYVIPTHSLEHGQIVRYSEAIGDVRLSGVQAPEDPYKNSDAMKNNAELKEIYKDHPGVQATKFARERLEGEHVALRIYRARRQDDYGRTIAYVFHNAPDNLTSEEDKRRYLLEAAGRVPLLPWDSYTPDGKPLTFDWELVTSGHGEIEARELGNNVEGITRGDLYGENRTGGLR